MIQRLLTGIIFVVILMAGILINSYAFLAIFGIIVMLTLYEFYGLVQKNGDSPQKVIGTIFGVLFFVLVFLISQKLLSVGWLVLFIPASILLLISELYRKKEQPYTGFGFTLLGFAYVSLSLSSLNYFISNPILGSGFHHEFLLAFFVLIWTSDTGAYLVGSRIGKNRLFERISPKKSWEGSIGGLFFAVGGGILFSTFFTQLSLIQWIGFSVIVSVFGTYGDLVESLFKRKLGIKDSGKILPGHGGMLDRFDSAILAAPAIFSFLYLLSALK